MSEISQIFLSTRKLIADVVSKIVPASEVEDIIQDTYIKMHSVEDKDRIKKPEAFMVQVAKNLAYDYVKSARVRTTSHLDEELLKHFEELDADNARDATLNDVALKRDFANFCGQLSHLPEKCRRVYVMKKVYGYSQKEIAEKEGISASTVEKHIAYGTKRMFHLMCSGEDAVLELNSTKIKAG